MKYAQFIALSPPGLEFTISLILIEWLWKKHWFSAIFAVCFKAAQSILKISWIKDREVKEQWIMHIWCIHHFVFGPILADLIRPTFCHFCQSSRTEKTQTFFFPIFPTIGCISQRSDWSAHGACRLCKLTGQYTEPSYSMGHSTDWHTPWID